MATSKKSPVPVLCLGAVAIILIGLTWAYPWWPEALLLLLYFALLCPNHNVLSSSCNAGFSDYLGPWALFLSLIAVLVFFAWRRVRRGRKTNSGQ